MRRIVPALGLFLLSPLVAEYLLGNIAISSLSALLTLAPLYGGGALLIREVARRTGRGWPTIVVLGTAYAVFEEAFTTQSLFNPNYVGEHLLAPAYIPALGMGGWWTLYVLTLHTVWSICVPIAVVETLAASRSAAPWLGRVGMVVVPLVFVLGAAVTTAFSLLSDPFRASVPQMVGAGVAVVVLVTVAMLLGRSDLTPVPVDGRRAPSPWLLGVLSLVAASGFIALSVWGNAIPWLTVAVYVVLFVVVTVMVRRWSRSADWSAPHVFALAAGAMLAYAWNSFPQPPSLPADPTVDLIGNGVFAAGAVVLIVVTTLRLRAARPASKVTVTAAQPNP